jgi:RimJ/RimL family protein N-acetyltransferase
MADLGESVGDWTAPPAPGPMTLNGRYALLEPLAAAHAEDLHAANAEDREGRIWDYLPNGPFTGPAYRDWVKSAETSRDPLFFAVFDKDSGLYGGVMSYLRITPAAGTIEIGHICFAPRLQRRRAATEAVYLLMTWAFEAGYRRFEWKCNALNLPSRRAAERFGLSYEGIFRQAAVIKGRNRDTAWFAAIDREWPALRGAFEAWLDPANFDAAGRQRTSLGELTRGILVTRDPVLAG